MMFDLIFPTSLCHFNSLAPQGRMLVQTDLTIKGCLKSCEFHVHSSSDLLRKAFVGFVSHLELYYNHLVNVSGAVCNMMRKVAASQPHKNRVHIGMLPSVWLMIKRYLLEETKEKRLEIYYDNAVILPNVKRGVCVTPDKRIHSYLIRG
jgi:hypothetical protein